MSTNRKHTSPTQYANHVIIVIAQSPDGDYLEIGDNFGDCEFRLCQRHYLGYEVEKWFAGRFLGRYLVTKAGLLPIPSWATTKRPAPAANPGRKVITGPHDGLIKVGQLRTSKLG